MAFRGGRKVDSRSGANAQHRFKNPFALIAQADDGGRILVCEAVGEFSRGGTRGPDVGRVHDPVESTLDGGLIDLF